MRVGITLPTFTADAEAPVRRALEAEAAGIHGAFVFDHLWPIGQPERPALSAYPMLAAVAAVTSTIRVGLLVARIGLLPDSLVEASLVSIDELSSGRLVAGLGIGDAKSQAENDAYGIETRPVEDRRASLARLLASLGRAGIERWVGATAPATLEVARAAGVAINLWDVTAERVAAEAALGPVTWGGPLPADHAAAAEQLGELQAAGASWVICAWPGTIELVVSAARRSGVVLGTE